MTLFKSERLFSVYTYRMSRGILLLRAGKTTAAEKRIDVLFQDVRAMEVRAWFTGLTVEEIDLEEIRAYPSAPLELYESGNRAFRLVGAGWTGFVLGGSFFVREDEGNLFEPSSILEQDRRYM